MSTSVFEEDFYHLDQKVLTKYITDPDFKIIFGFHSSGPVTVNKDKCVWTFCLNKSFI